jgi:hypothetical protein
MIFIRAISIIPQGRLHLSVEGGYCPIRFEFHRIMRGDVIVEGC